MSHFTTIEAGLTDKQALVKGLENLLAKHNIKANVECHEKPVTIFNDYGYSEELNSLAEVIIRKEQIGGKTDIGFAKEEGKETYKAVVDAYDFKRTQLSSAFSSVGSFLKAVQEAHAEAFIEREYPSDLWAIETKVEGTKTVRTLTKKVTVGI